MIWAILSLSVSLSLSLCLSLSHSLNLAVSFSLFYLFFLSFLSNLSSQLNPFAMESSDIIKAREASRARVNLDSTVLYTFHYIRPSTFYKTMYIVLDPVHSRRPSAFLHTISGYYNTAGLFTAKRGMRAPLVEPSGTTQHLH